MMLASQIRLLVLVITAPSHAKDAKAMIVIQINFCLHPKTPKIVAIKINFLLISKSKEVVQCKINNHFYQQTKILAIKLTSTCRKRAILT